MVSEELRAMIPDYVRGLLSPTDAKEVEAALESSPEIYPEFEAAQSYYSALNQIPEVKAPSDFVFRVNHRIDSVPFWPRIRGILFEPLALKLPFELAGVAACLVISLVLFNPFSSRGRLRAEKPVAAAVRKAAVPEESRAAPATVSAEQAEPAAVPAFQETADKAAAETATPTAAAAPAPELPAVKAETPAPKPLEPASVAAGLPAAKTPAAPVKPAAIASVPPPVSEPAPALAAKRMAAKEAPEKKAEAVKQDMTTVAPRRAMMPSLDAIPTLPSVAMAAPVSRPAPAAAPAPRAAAPAPAAPTSEAEAVAAPAASAAGTPKTEASAKPKAKSLAEDIGTVDLSLEDGSLSSATAETAENILSTSVVTCKKTIKDGKTAFVCKLPPERLNLLIESLARSFGVTTHLFPYDAAATKLVAVTFIIQ
jgi:hypothetical protein